MRSPPPMRLSPVCRYSPLSEAASSRLPTSRVARTERRFSAVSKLANNAPPVLIESESNAGIRDTDCTTPPTASLPYRAAEVPRITSSRSTDDGGTSANHGVGAARKIALFRRIPSTRCSTDEPLRPRMIAAPWPGVVCCTETPAIDCSASVSSFSFATVS